MLVVGETVVLGRDSSVLDEPSERAAPNEAFVLTGSVEVLGSSRSFADCVDRAADRYERNISALDGIGSVASHQ
jgi:hypothetical protein